MKEKIQYRVADKSDLPAITKLLGSNELPVEDIARNKIDFLIASNSIGEIVGSIGIEKYGEEALLRSFAVEKTYQKQRIGAELLNRIYNLSAQLGIKTLHLLTTTAEAYFEAKGFFATERNNAPEAIKQTSEFTSLCPSSSVYMYNKNISPL